MTKYRSLALLVAAMLVAGCGGGDEATGGGVSTGDDAGSASTPSDSADDDGTVGSSGELQYPQPPGQAYAQVDGLEFTFTDPGAAPCNVASDTFTFSFLIGENEVVLGGGANLYDGTWVGSPDLRVWNLEDGDGGTATLYWPDLMSNGDRLVIDGQNVEYVGPMRRNDPDDRANIEGLPAGDGVFSMNCQ